MKTFTNSTHLLYTDNVAVRGTAKKQTETGRTS